VTVTSSPADLKAVNAVEVRPRVSGYLQSVHFKEGAVVRQGELLFQIDPRPFQAEVDRLKGDLSQARAQRSRAQSDFERAERLHNNDGMSAEEYDRRAAVRNEAEARIASTEGALRGAELNLEFTRVTAPITGSRGTGGHHGRQFGRERRYAGQAPDDTGFARPDLRLLRCR